MRSIPVHDLAGLGALERAELEAAVQTLRTLADVLAWARAHTPARVVADIVTQDEYTHDVVVAAPGEPFLAFDTT